MTQGAQVVVTGIGVTLPAGLSAGEAIERAMHGSSAIAPLQRFNATGYAARAAAEVPAFDLAATLRIPKNEKFMGRAVACGVRAALQAVAESGLDTRTIDPYQLGIYTGCGQTGLDTSEFFAALDLAETGEEASAYRRLGGRASRLLDRYWSLRTLANAGLGLLAAELSARGPCNNFVQGDIASAQAIAAACHDLTEGRSDVVIAGGYDSLLTVSTYLAYEQAGVLSTQPADRAHRPFDRDRDGLVLGEGAAFVVLERGEDARRRSAPILAEVIGAGFSQEQDDADGRSQAWHAAIGAAAGDIRPDFVIAHGIGTLDADRYEARVLGQNGLRDTPMSAFKGLTGYLGAATAAAEFALAVLAARQRTVPPVAHFERPDQDCPLDLVSGAPRALDAAAPAFVSLSRSWSGQCAAIAARAVVA